MGTLVVVHFTNSATLYRVDFVHQINDIQSPGSLGNQRSQTLTDPPHVHHITHCDGGCISYHAGSGRLYPGTAVFLHVGAVAVAHWAFTITKHQFGP